MRRKTVITLAAVVSVTLIVTALAALGGAVYAARSVSTAALRGAVAGGTSRPGPGDMVRAAASRAKPRPKRPAGPLGRFGFGARGRAGRGPMMGMLGACMRGVGLQNAAKLLGMTRAELWKATSGGETLAAIAKKKGVSTEDLLAALIKPQEDLMKQAVAAGVITQQHYDVMIERMKTVLKARIEGRILQGGPGAGAGGMMDL